MQSVLPGRAESRGGAWKRLIAFGLMAAGSICAAEPKQLKLVRAWSVEGPGHFQPSGLALRGDDLFTVSDRHQDTVFQLDLERKIARAESAVRFTGPVPYPEFGVLDLEGIAAAPDGGFFLAAELGFAVLHVPKGGGTASWVTPNLRTVGESVGLFATRDAYVEGLAVLGDGHFLVAAERQPRGIIEVFGGMKPTRLAAQNLDFTAQPWPDRKNALDFADLCVWRGRVFALARNQHLVVELVHEESGEWREADAWSYSDTEQASAFRYVDMAFGSGEGLAINDRLIYVMLDNNELAREGAPQDHRPWLFSFKNVIRK